jgi:hypothetical protein
MEHWPGETALDAGAYTCTMVTEKIRHNARDLEAELRWFAALVDARMKMYFGKEKGGKQQDISPPKLGGKSLYADLVKHYNMSLAERTALALALAPHIRPQLLDVFLAKNANLDRGYSEFGGIAGKQHGGFLPTGETLMFLLSGVNLEARFTLYSLFDRDHFFARHNILKLDTPADGEPMLSGQLRITSEYLDYLTTGQVRKPDFSANFPAKYITTLMDWGDLVLEENTLQQLEEIRAWMEHGHTLLHDWGLRKKVRPGYRSLFYGPPGTGKTLTACLLGKASGRDVYKIDLSTVVSKYIGETEKNLSKIFDQAENKEWILFFDEADALFGKRSEVRDSHDRYANIEISYLLQRMEAYDGVTILATNLRANLDEAFTRRLQFAVDLPFPEEEDRLRIWRTLFPARVPRAADLDFPVLARRFKLAGGNIRNALVSAAYLASSDGQRVTMAHLLHGVRRELQKMGRLVGDEDLDWGGQDGGES